MIYSDFKEAVIVHARAAGLADYDLYYTHSLSTSVQAWEGEIDAFSDNASTGVSFRCMKDGKAGYSNTQKLDAAEARRLVEDAVAGTAIIGQENAVSFYQGGGTYTPVPQAAESSCDVDRLKAMALAVERELLAFDPRIVSVNDAAAQFAFREVGLYTSAGLDLSNRQSGYYLMGGAVAEADGRKYNGFGLQEALTADQCSVSQVVAEAAGLALGSIGGSSLPSGSYPVIFTSRMACALLSCFASVFSGDAAQKGLSLLTGREHQQIASPLVTLTDDPHYSASSDKSPFDDEGVPTFAKAVIEGGVLKTLLYDLRSAAKTGQSSTGNGRRAGYASDIGVSPFTLRLTPGDMSQAQLMERAGRGVLITEMKGLHASASPITGDFSLESKGYLFENGKLLRPVEQLTIAGNFYTLLRGVEGVGSDLDLSDGIAAPSLLISALTVAGE